MKKKKKHGAGSPWDEPAFLPCTSYVLGVHPQSWQRKKNGAISTTDRVVWNIDSNIEVTILSLVVLL